MVVMGGVRIDTEAMAKFGYPPPRFGGFQQHRQLERFMHLSPEGVIRLAERGCWLYIKPERIVAKTKADVLQKALVLLQVSYAATSCIARRVYGLPLTLLEVHTMVHVICAVAMYALWFKVSPEYSFWQYRY